MLKETLPSSTTGLLNVVCFTVLIITYFRFYIKKWYKIFHRSTKSHLVAFVIKLKGILIQIHTYSHFQLYKVSTLPSTSFNTKNWITETVTSGTDTYIAKKSYHIKKGQFISRTEMNMFIKSREPQQFRTFPLQFIAWLNCTTTLQVCAPVLLGLVIMEAQGAKHG